jgi:3-methyladenine DNA glycosylase AlkC
MGLIKDIYSPAFYEQFAKTLEQTLPVFNKQQFLKQMLIKEFYAMEFKQRMKHTTAVLHTFLPNDFSKAVILIEKIIIQLRKNKSTEDQLVFAFFPDYIETYGLNDFNSSVKAIESITQFVSCEFAVRPFFLKFGKQMMDQMVEWSLHENYKVRRLASEGSRSRLPWGIALPAFKKDPKPLLPLLENLKNDPSEWVRKSVANNLNDIAKDNPEVVLAIAAKWKGIGKGTDAIIKHGCRTLLKQGHIKILKHYGLNTTGIVISNFRINTPKVKIGDPVEFHFTVRNSNSKSKIIRLEYAVYYNKANGQLSKKVFKISERLFKQGETSIIKRKQSFKLITTRKFYTGKHKLSLIINGEEKQAKTFELVNSGLKAL